MAKTTTDNREKAYSADQDQTLSNEVKEPEVVFNKNVGSKSSANKATAATNGRRRSTTVIVEGSDGPEWQMTPLEKMAVYREGISKQRLEILKRKANLDYDTLSTLLATTRATLINKKGAEHFSPSLSERILSIADVYSYGFEVFEDEAKFNAWVSHENRALGGKRPIDFLDNQFGREEVKNLLGRIEYGVYS